MIPRRSVLRDAIMMRRMPVVSPLWALYHGRGDDLIRDMAAMGDEVAWDLGHGPMFAEEVVFGPESVN